MPMPLEIARASEDYNRFLAEAADILHLTTRNQTYTAVQAVLLVFRKRLTSDQILIFADILPPVLKAIFVKGWKLDEFETSFPERSVLLMEVKSLRRHHNFSPDNAIEGVATVLRNHVGDEVMASVLKELSPEAEAYWHVPD